jgi:two-component system, chemotaxis family, chemotaxis protein CheY
MRGIARVAEVDELQRQRVLERRFQAMGLDAGLLPGGRAVVATLPLGAAPFDTHEGPRVLRAARFYTLGYDRIKCMAPRALFHLAPIRIVGCQSAADLEDRIRKAWDARMRTLRDAERWLATLDVPAEVHGTPVFQIPLGLDDAQARAAVIEPGRVILPSRGALSGQTLEQPAERVLEPTANSGTELAIAITVRMEALARRRRDISVRRVEVACDLPAPRNAHAAQLLLVGPRLAAARPLHESLRLRGFRVECVNSPSAAVEAFRSHSFGLVLTDTRLDRGDGIELIPALRSLPGVLDLPVVLLDERPSDPRRAAAKDAGACGYLAGALDGSRLATALAQIASDRKRRRFARYPCAVSVSWPECATPAVTAEIGRGGVLLRGTAPTPPRAKFALHLPESGLTLRVDAATAYRLREGPDWSADGVGLRFASFEPGEESDWIGYLLRLQATKPEMPPIAK